MNKKILLGIIIFIFTTLTIQAQHNSYGFRIGLNYSDIDFDDNISGISGDSDARIGFAAGFFIQYSIAKKFSIQPELQYSAQGERTDVDNDRLKVNVLQLPVLLNFHLNKIALSAGPQIGIRVWEWERTNDYETLQFSGVLGISYDITDYFQATLRGSYGLTDAIKTDNEESVFNATGANHYLQFTVAFKI